MIREPAWDQINAPDDEEERAHYIPPFPCPIKGCGRIVGDCPHPDGLRPMCAGCLFPHDGYCEDTRDPDPDRWNPDEGGERLPK